MGGWGLHANFSHVNRRSRKMLGCRTLAFVVPRDECDVPTRPQARSVQWTTTIPAPRMV